MENDVTKDIILYILSTSYKRKVGRLLDQSIRSGTPMVDVARAEVEKIIETDFQDIYPTQGLLGYLAKLFKLVVPKSILSSIKRRIPKDKARIYINKYEMPWR